MKCKYSENDVALYVEGDLTPEQAHRMEAHLTMCRVCNELALDLRESQLMLKGLRQDTVSAAALSSVRTRVLAEIERRHVRWTWSRWVFAAAGFMIVAAVGAGLFMRSSKPQPLPEVVKTRTPPAIEDSSGNSSTPLLPKEGRREAPGRLLTPKRPARATTPSAPKAQPPLLTKEGNKTAQPVPAKQLLVKLLTDDPNIVIYWLVDQTGGTL